MLAIVSPNCGASPKCGNRVSVASRSAACLAACLATISPVMVDIERVRAVGIRDIILAGWAAALLEISGLNFASGLDRLGKGTAQERGNGDDGNGELHFDFWVELLNPPGTSKKR